MQLSQNRGPEIIAVDILFLSLTVIFLSLRCYCRGFVVKSFGLDDWFALLSGVLYICFIAFQLTSVSHGVGQHMINLSVDQLRLSFQWWWTCELIYVLCNMALKISIGFMLLRLAVERSHKMIIWTVIVVTEIYGFVYFFIFVLQCRPLSFFWTRFTDVPGSCSDPNITVIATYVNSAISCIGDWTFAIVPVFIIWNLQMNQRTKISVAVILAMGALASTATLVRMPYVHTLKDTTDFLYSTTEVAIWSGLETGIGLFASNLATLRPLFLRFYGRSGFTGGNSSNPKASVGYSWRASGTRHGPHGGYQRNESNPDVKEDQLDFELGTGVTTVIGAGPSASIGGEISTKASAAPVREKLEKKGVAWSESEINLAERDSEEEERWVKEQEMERASRNITVSTTVLTEG